jgi:hypothetical protein
METEPRPEPAQLAEVDVVYWLLCAVAGCVWSYPIVAIATEFRWEGLVFGSVIGVLMGALILPWIRKQPISEMKAFALGVVTLILAAPTFMIFTDLLRAEPIFKYDPWSLLTMWLGITCYSVGLYGVILVPLATLTVYGLWRWLDFRNRSC